MDNLAQQIRRAPNSWEVVAGRMTTLPLDVAERLADMLLAYDPMVASISDIEFRREDRIVIHYKPSYGGKRLSFVIPKWSPMT